MLFQIIIIILYIPLFMEAQVTDPGYYWTGLNGNSNFEPCEFTVPKNTGTSRTEPVQMPGWPINIGAAANQSPSGICLADIHGDGILEIIVGSTNGVIHVFNSLGNDLPGWPKTGLEAIRSKVAVGDIDPDYPGLEIVAVGQTNSLYVWHNDGTTVSGFPQSIGNQGILKAPVISDIDNDGDLEIIVGQNSVRVYNHDGNDEPGWPKLNVAGLSSYAQPTFADLDNDGDLEILHAYFDQWPVPSDNYIAIYHHDGTNYGNWPQMYLGAHTYLTPAVGDIDNDGDLEIIGGRGNGFEFFAKHHTGETVAGWPVEVSAILECSPIVFDLDNDGYREVLIGENMWDPNGDFWAYNHDGSTVEDWPIAIVNATMVNSAAVGDVDGDGDIEIALIVSGGTVNLWTVENVPYRKYLTEWGTFFHDNWNTGWYHPLAPQSPIACFTGNSVNLNWLANTEPDLSGYNIYKSIDSGVSYNKINNELISATSYTDESGAANYLYCITAEILADAESKFSNEAIFQTSWIEGVVTLNGGTGNIEDVVVTAGNISANPDASGVYSIGIYPGTYDVIALLDGYETDTIIDVLVEEGQITGGIDFNLYPSVGIEDKTLSSKITLNGNYPNPFNPETTISFQISNQQNEQRKLTIYNLKGQKIRQYSIFNNQSSIVWDGRDENGNNVSSGIYFYKLISGEFSETRKMILMK